MEVFETGISSAIREKCYADGGITLLFFNIIQLYNTIIQFNNIFFTFHATNRIDYNIII